LSAVRRMAEKGYLRRINRRYKRVSKDASPSGKKKRRPHYAPLGSPTATAVGAHAPRRTVCSTVRPKEQKKPSKEAMSS